MPMNEVPTLTSLYRDRACAALLAPQPFVEGLIIAVAACPEIPLPEQWMPWTIRIEENAAVSSTLDLQPLTSSLMQYFTDVLAAMRARKMLVPTRLNSGLSAHQAQVPESVMLWCQGVMTGHQQLESVWQCAWTSEAAARIDSAEKRLERCLRLFSTLASPDMALQRRDEASRARLQAALPQLVSQLGIILQDYILLADELAQCLPHQFETFTAPPG